MKTYNQYVIEFGDRFWRVGKAFGKAEQSLYDSERAEISWKMKMEGVVGK